MNKQQVKDDILRICAELAAIDAGIECGISFELEFARDALFEALEKLNDQTEEKMVGGGKE